mmetsp:Transcript_46115/g.74289  ORF Transcript_46115/g.74289 Transcript_46115/m.74289 type:complete len:96 (+) Transcript_46115:135-422(+)
MHRCMLVHDAESTRERVLRVFVCVREHHTSVVSVGVSVQAVEYGRCVNVSTTQVLCVCVLAVPPHTREPHVSLIPELHGSLDGKNQRLLYRSYFS